MIVDDLVLHYILNWSFLIYDIVKNKTPQEKMHTEKLLKIQSRCEITPLPQK